jgi:hypothetical protein
VALIEVNPSWRGYRYALADDEIIIVDRNYEIVEVISYEGGSGSGTASRSRTTATETDSEVYDLTEVEIREIQTVLIQRGYYRGRPDGRMSRDFERAVITFQRREGLQATGRIDSRTVSSLGLSAKITSRRDGNRQGTSQPAQPSSQQTGQPNQPSSPQQTGQPAQPSSPQQTGQPAQPSSPQQTGQPAQPSPSQQTGQPATGSQQQTGSQNPATNPSGQPNPGAGNTGARPGQNGQSESRPATQPTAPQRSDSSTNPSGAAPAPNPPQRQ